MTKFIYLRTVWLVAVSMIMVVVPAGGGVHLQGNLQTFMVPMRDGIQLATDVYVPAGQGPFPVVLLRNPYNKAAGTGIGNDGAKRGFAVVIQDTRGRFASQGAGFPFEGDGWWDGKEDGTDTCGWILKQPWCNGKISTMGGSALGITQLGLAGAGAPGVVSQVIHVAAPSYYRDMVFPGGVFKKNMIETWLSVTQHNKESLKQWTSHPALDAYWRARELETRFSKANAPAMHVGGWFDIFAQGSIDAFNGFQQHGGLHAKGRQKLIMGPWSHGIFQPKAGELEFKNGKTPSGKAHDTWEWFASTMKQENPEISHSPAVTYYVMGDTSDPSAPGNEWRTANSWPPPGSSQKSLYFTANRQLTWSHPGSGEIRFRYDPATPAPTVGGRQLVLPAGAKEQSEVESRGDVVVLSTEPLSNPVEVTGRVRANITVSSDCLDTDLFVRLCDVYPTGKSYNMAEGQLRLRFRNGFHREALLKPGKPVSVSVDLGPTSIIFNKGHRIRIQVTSSSDPGFDPNPNTGKPFRADSEKRVATNVIHIGSSRVILPVMSAKSNILSRSASPR